MASRRDARLCSLTFNVAWKRRATIILSLRDEPFRGIFGKIVLVIVATECEYRLTPEYEYDLMTERNMRTAKTG